MSQKSEHSPSSHEPRLSEVISELDSADLDLRMAYSRYLDRPSPRRMVEVGHASVSVSDAFYNLLRKVLQGVEYDTPINYSEKALLIATIVQGMNYTHSEVLIDHTDTIKLPTDLEQQEIQQSMAEALEEELEESFEAFIDSARGHVNGVLDSDMKTIERYVLQRASTLQRRLGELTLKASGEVAKVGLGVIVGVFITDKLRRS